MNEKLNISKKIQDYWGLAIRRKWSIIIPVLLSIPISFAAYSYIPKVYQATTLILVQPQKVPQEYIRSTVTTPVTERLTTIRQEILNRTSLEKVIQEFGMYPKERDNFTMEEVVELVRTKINISVQGRSGAQTTFSVGFEGNDPVKVMNVTNKLAELFIQENLRAREIQAAGTSDFLSSELNLMEDRLKAKEKAIREFKESNMGQLPQQLEANLRILERLQQQLQMTNEAIKVSDERIFLYQNQIEHLESRIGEKANRTPSPMQTGILNSGVSATRESGEMASGPSIPEGPRGGGEMASGPPTLEDPLVSQLNRMRKELSDLRLKYTENHPDVMKIKSQIATLEPRVKEKLEEQKALQEARLRERRELLAERERRAGEQKRNQPQPPVYTPVPHPVDPALERSILQYQDQLTEARLQIVRLKRESENLKEQIRLYQVRIEETPKREQQLNLLTRDYDQLRLNYQSLLDKKMQSQMAENLERRQQSEQFKILDPARVPEKPIRPKAHVIFPAGIALGLMLGGGLAWLRESMDQSFHSDQEVEDFLGLKVLITIPNLKRE